MKFIRLLLANQIACTFFALIIRLGYFKNFIENWVIKNWDMENSGYQKFELSKARVIESSSYRKFELSKFRVIESSSYRKLELSKARVIESSSYRKFGLSKARVIES